MPTRMPDRSLNIRQSLNNNFELQFSALRERIEMSKKRRRKILISRKRNVHGVPENGTDVLAELKTMTYAP